MKNYGPEKINVFFSFVLDIYFTPDFYNADFSFSEINKAFIGKSLFTKR